MSKVVVDVSMSLDGYATGPNVRPEEPMGDDGESLHEWFAARGPNGAVDRSVVERLNATVGAVILGRRTFDLGLSNWGGTPWPGVPTFVVTHRIRDDLVGDNGGTFAFDGMESAVERAREAAGEKEVKVLGADVTQQLIRAGLLDEVHLHLVPMLMGSGTRLFDGVPARLIPEGEPLAGSATHLRYRVVRS